MTEIWQITEVLVFSEQGYLGIGLTVLRMQVGCWVLCDWDLSKVASGLLEDVYNGIIVLVKVISKGHFGKHISWWHNK